MCDNHIQKDSKQIPADSVKEFQKQVGTEIRDIAVTPCDADEIPRNCEKQGDGNDGNQTLDRSVKQIVCSRGVQSLEPASKL